MQEAKAKTAADNSGFAPNKMFRPMPKCSHAESTLRLSLVLASMGKHVLIQCADRRRARSDYERLGKLASEGMYRDGYRIELDGARIKIWMAA